MASNTTFTTPATDAHRDPLTGAPGAHPVGTGIGAVLGGAAAVLQPERSPGLWAR